MWMGYDGVGTIAVSPGPSRTHMRWVSPSLAPMTLMTSVSGSSSTPNRRWYKAEAAARSLGMPRLAEYRWLRELRAARETMMMVAGSVETYGSRGETVSVERRARLVDEAI